MPTTASRPALVRLVAVLGAILLVLAACGSDDDPAPEPAPVEPEPEEEEPEPEPEPEPDPEPTDLGTRSPLTGLEVDEDLLDQPVVMVKVDNAPQARPQAGLDRADIVYEEVVEAGVTRFFAVFHADVPDVVGPVRSARPVDVQLMSGYGRGGFAYSGARPEVRALMGGAPTITVTEGGAGFFRDSSRRAPHNLYLDATALRAALVEREADPVADATWRFDADVPDGALACPSGDEAIEACDDPGAAIDIRMSSSYATQWSYDAEEEVYRRRQNRGDFTVTGAGVIGAANVIVLDTRHYLGEPNCYGNRCPETDVVTGADERAALVLRDGQRYEARWRKTEGRAALEILTVDGEAFPLKPGRSWVHLPDGLPGLDR